MTTSTVERHTLHDEATHRASYPLTVHVGHWLVDIGDARYLIDTGSPTSLGEIPVALIGQRGPARPDGSANASTASLVELVGTPFVGLIGMDVLGGLDLEFSVPERRLTVAEAPVERLGSEPITTLAGVPIVAVGVGEESVRLFLDTGAPLSYLHRRLANLFERLDDAEDFHPLMGRFVVPTHRACLRFGDTSRTLRAGVMPPLLEAALDAVGVAGILGTEAFEQGSLWLSCRQQRFASGETTGCTR